MESQEALTCPSIRGGILTRARYVIRGLTPIPRKRPSLGKPLRINQTATATILSDVDAMPDNGRPPGVVRQP